MSQGTAKSLISPNVISTGVTPAAAMIVKAGPGVLQSLYVMNRNAQIRYIGFANQTLLPSDFSSLLGTPIFLPSGVAVILGTDFFSAKGIYFSTGIGIIISTSNTTFSAATAGDHDIMATYL